MAGADVASYDTDRDVFLGSYRTQSAPVAVDDLAVDRIVMSEQRGRLVDAPFSDEMPDARARDDEVLVEDRLDLVDLGGRHELLHGRADIGFVRVRGLRERNRQHEGDGGGQVGFHGHSSGGREAGSTRGSRVMARRADSAARCSGDPPVVGMSLRDGIARPGLMVGPRSGTRCARAADCGCRARKRSRANRGWSGSSVSTRW